MRFVLFIEDILPDPSEIPEANNLQSQEDHFSLSNLNFSRCNFRAFSSNLPPWPLGLKPISLQGDSY
jgi:hypothetical protein